MNKHLKLPRNDKGRDLIVGDLHGCFDQLWELLEHLKYDPNVDRLMFVGDLVDRGPKSLECIDLVKMDGVYSTLGNHEDMMFRAVMDRDANMYDTWMYNGGGWARQFLDYWIAFDVRLQPLRHLFPHMISVGEGADRFNIVHAELFSHQRPLCDENIDNWDFSPEEEHNMLWGRAIINYGDLTDHLFHYNMSPTYCGHTPVRAVTTFQSQIFIDTGCCYAIGKQGQSTDLGLTIVSHQQQRYWTIHPSDANKISTYDIPPLLN